MSIKAHLEFLIQSGMSQVEIAKLAACTQPTISRILSGKHSCTNFDLGSRILAVKAKKKRPAFKKAA